MLTSSLVLIILKIISFALIISSSQLLPYAVQRLLAQEQGFSGRVVFWVLVTVVSLAEYGYLVKIIADYVWRNLK